MYGWRESYPLRVENYRPSVAIQIDRRRIVKECESTSQLTSQLLTRLLSVAIKSLRFVIWLRVNLVLTHLG